MTIMYATLCAGMPPTGMVAGFAILAGWLLAIGIVKAARQ
jgi:hypothetical protein